MNDYYAFTLEREPKDDGDFAGESNWELIEQAIDRVEEVLQREGWNIAYDNHPAVAALKRMGGRHR